VVPDECTVSIDRRVVSGETTEQVLRQLELVVRRASSLPYSIHNHLVIDAFYQDPNTEWLQNLSAWSGKAPALEPYGTNAWAYGDVADECVVLGPGSIAQAHGLEEWVAVSELVALAEIYRKWWQL
jgi:acetylornithine deacetylase/succinyl-diaminopimelate desuccinylase-like protein